MKINQSTAQYFAKEDIFLVPIILLITIVPLIVRLKIIQLAPYLVDFWDNTSNADFFSYYKSRLILILSFLSISALAYGVITGSITIRKTLLYIPMAIYIFPVILSSLFSKYNQVAFGGFPDRYEGAYVIIAYIAALFCTINLINSERQVKLVTGGLLFSSALIGVIGLLQYFGLDILKELNLLVPISRNNTSGIVKSVSETGTAFGTLYNPNVFGMYMSMLLPLSFLFFLQARRRYIKIITAFISFILFAGLLGSNSRGSYISVAFSAVFIIVLTGKQLKTNWRRVVGIVLCFAAIFGIMNIFSNRNISTRIGSVISMSDIHKEDESIDKIKNFEINGTQLTLYCTNSLLKILIKDKQLVFYDGNDKELALTPDSSNQSYSLKDEKYAGYDIMLSKNIIKICKGKSFLYFVITADSFSFVNSKGKVLEKTAVESIGFEGKERLASGRGYIWSRTLSLLKDTLVLGHGPDTYAFYFPQNDYMGKLNFMYDANLIIDKPHNLYLQISVNTGLLSLVALLFLFGVYLIKSVSLLYRSRFDNFSHTASLAITASIIGYLISGLFTDSTVSVAPVFWILLGLGISVHYLGENLS